MSENKIFLKDIIDKSVKDLVKFRIQLKKDLYVLRFKNIMKSLRETHKIKILKKKIAQVQFVLYTKING